MRKTLICLALLSLVFATQVVQQSVADELNTELDNMIREVKDEQASHEEVFRQQQSDCQNEVDFRRREIADGENSLNQSVIHQSSCSSSKAVSESDISTSEAYKVQIAGIVENLANIRSQEFHSFESLINEEIDPALEALDGAYAILDDYQANGVGFVQFTKGMNKVFRQMIKAKKTDKFAAVATALVQMQTSELSESGKEVVAQIRRLFRELENDLNDAKQAATELELQRRETYNQYITEYKAIYEQLQANIQRLTVYVAELNQCINREAEVQASASDKIAHNTDALNHAVEFCLALAQQFENGTNDRNAEVSLLVKIQRFVDEQADIFGDYGNDGVDTFQEFKQNYEAQRRANHSNFLQVRSKKVSKKFSCPTCKTFVQKKLRQ